MTGPEPLWQVAECLLPGLSRATAEALGRRVRQEIAGPLGSQVSYLGSLLMPEDEVLLCLFAGPEAEVRAVSERAGLPFERILACIGVGWRTGREAAVNEPGAAEALPAPAAAPAPRGKDENSRRYRNGRK